MIHNKRVKVKVNNINDNIHSNSNDNSTNITGGERPLFRRGDQREPPARRMD